MYEIVRVICPSVSVNFCYHCAVCGPLVRWRLQMKIQPMFLSANTLSTVRHCVKLTWHALGVPGTWQTQFVVHTCLTIKGVSFTMVSPHNLFCKFYFRWISPDTHLARSYWWLFLLSLDWDKFKQVGSVVKMPCGKQPHIKASGLRVCRLNWSNLTLIL